MFHEIPCISSQVTLATKFLSQTHRQIHSQTHRQIHSQAHRQTDRHFLEIVKSCSGHPKTCKCIKNWKSEIFRKPIHSSSYTEEIEKEKTLWMTVLHEKHKTSF